MSDGICPFATLLQGASWGENGSRRLSVTAVTIHTTEGRNSVGLGQGRTHSSPGTFNFLTGAKGELWQFYPADVRCSHAAGGNNVGPGIENEGFTGQPFPDAQLATLGRLCHWLNDTYGVPLVYKSGDPRIYLDQSGYRGFIAHRAIDYPPNRSYNHYDLITDDEWSRAIGGSPAPPPDDHEHDIEEDDMSETLASWTADNVPGEWHYAQVAGGGDAYHSWGPGDKGFEFLCGPSVPDTTRRTPAPITKVTRKLGAGSLTRLDLFFELEDSDDVAHMWRNRNADKWGFEITHPGS